MILQIFLSLLSSALALEKCINGTEKGIIQQPKHIVVQSGETVVINCTVTNQVESLAIKLRKRFTDIIYMNKQNQCIVGKEYVGRFTCSRKGSHLSVVLRNLTEDDSDFYLCDGKSSIVTEIYGAGTFIFVEKPLEKKDNQTGIWNTQAKPASGSSTYLPYIITACGLIIVSVIVVLVIKYRTSMEKKNFAQNTYVDMTQTRRNTMGHSNIYSKPLNADG